MPVAVSTRTADAVLQLFGALDLSAALLVYYVEQCLAQIIKNLAVARRQDLRGHLLFPRLVAAKKISIARREFCRTTSAPMTTQLSSEATTTSTRPPTTNPTPNASSVPCHHDPRRR
jgi:hypothetical protein